MADVLFTTIGTLGDLFPLLGVGSELAGRGHQVRVGAPPVWRREVESSGLDFVSLGTTSTFREFTEHPEILAPIPWGLRRAMHWFMFDQIDQLTDELMKAMSSADLVVSHPAHIASHDVAEKLRIPRVVATVFPMMIPSSHTVPGGSKLGPWHGRLGRTANRMAWHFGELGSAALFDRPINRHRASLGLPPVRAAMIHLPLRAAATVVMAAPVFVDPPSDWPSTVMVTGFVEWDQVGSREVPDDLERFLEAGDPPVLVTLGVSSAIEPEDFLDSVANEVVQLGRRALVVTGPGERPRHVPERVHVIEYVPFSLVGRRCRAAVHHGGVGTTASFLRAGIPQVAVPKGFDQPLTAARLEALGVGRCVPWAKRHGRIGPALRDVVADAAMQRRAEQLAERVGSDGAVASADLIEGVIAAK